MYVKLETRRQVRKGQKRCFWEEPNPSFCLLRTLFPSTVRTHPISPSMSYIMDHPWLHAHLHLRTVSGVRSGGQMPGGYLVLAKVVRSGHRFRAPEKPGGCIATRK